MADKNGRKLLNRLLYGQGSAGNTNAREVGAAAAREIQPLSRHYINYGRRIDWSGIYVRYRHVETESEKEYHVLHAFNLNNP